MGNLVTLTKYSDFPLTTVLIIRRLAKLAKTIPNSTPPGLSTVGVPAARTTDVAAAAATPAATSAAAAPSITIDSRDDLKRSALHWACLRSDAVLVKLLVGFDADINAVDVFGCTPFHYAVWRAQDERLLEYLVRHGAMADAWTTGAPMTIGAPMMTGAPMPMAAPMTTCAPMTAGAPMPTGAPMTTGLYPSFHPQPREYLRQNALHIAAGAGNIIGIDFCLRAGIDVNYPASNGATPILFAAAWSRNNRVFDRLAQAGANLRVWSSERARV